MEHLALEIFDLADSTAGITALDSKYAYLPDDATITITDTSEIFANGDVWSHSFTLNVFANAHIFGTAGDIHGSRLHEQIDKRRARLWVDGLPLYLGYLRLNDEVEVDEDGNVDVTFESGQKTFDEMIEGAKANQVPMMGDVMIGLALWRKRWTTCSVEMQASATLSNGKTTNWCRILFDEAKTGRVEIDGEDDESSVQAYPRMVFPIVPEGAVVPLSPGGLTSVNCINTDHPYDEEHPYCNTALCYQRYGYEKKDEDGNTIYDDEPEAQRGYNVMPADRMNSAPNFFVIYWIRALMKHLGIHIDENQMEDVEDLKRLFFVNTDCAYKEPTRLRDKPTAGFARYRFAGYLSNNTVRLVPEYFGRMETEDHKVTYRRRENVNTDEKSTGFTEVSFTAGAPQYDHSRFQEKDVPEIKSVKVRIKEIMDWSDDERKHYESMNGFLHEAYATSDCFPDADISEVIKAVESGFGVRLLFSDDYKRVRIVLLRNIFKGSEVQDIQCDILGEMRKIENSIRGFRMTYGESTDTAFYYKGFADKMPHKKQLWQDTSDNHDYSHWKTDGVRYGDLINRISAFDKTCYVTGNTGNAFVIKVDKDAKRYDEMYPSLFGCADFMDAEDGDCTGEDETIETVSVGFKPAIMNDVNFENERGIEGDRHQLFALFVDETMRPRRPDMKDGADYNRSGTKYDIYGRDGLYGKYGPMFEIPFGGGTALGLMTDSDGIVKPGEFAAMSDTYVKNLASSSDMTTRLGYYMLDSGTPTGGEQPGDATAVFWDVSLDKVAGHITEGYRLYLQDNYEPNDDGVSPVETHDWGLTLGIMRGSGSDAKVEYSADPDDGEGNDTWDVVPGSSVTAHPDTCDNYGNIFDYTADGQEDEQDVTGRFSLKLRAEKPNPYFDPKKPEDVTIVKTKQEAADAMTRLFTTASPNLLSRSKVSLDLLRSKGWDAPGNGYATVFSVTYGVRYADGSVHDILFTPIGTGTILTPAQLQAYVHSFDRLEASAVAEHDTGGLILDIDTTDMRAQLLQELQALYYAEDGEETERVVIRGENCRYLEITNKSLRQRGLCDQFYKEYSKFIREARIASVPVRMELAQLLAIDKTKRATVGDITGFIKKMQYTVSNKTGLGEVTLEIMYI